MGRFVTWEGMEIIMQDSFVLCKKILEKYGQEHLLSFYDELDDDKKSMLLNQILKTDFEEITKLYKNSFIDDYNENDTVSPLSHIDKTKLSGKEINYYEQLGIDSIKKGQIAVVTVAGGQRHKITVIQDLKELLN